MAKVVGAATLESGELLTSTFKQVVIIPDVHGDEAALTRSLWLALKSVEGTNDVIDYPSFVDVVDRAVANSSFLPPILSLARTRSVALVQLGDLVDRGTSSVRCIEVMGTVQRVFGWKLISLYGNHELLNMEGMAGPAIHPLDAAKHRSLANRLAAFSHGRVVHRMLRHSYLAMARLSSGASDIALDDPINPNTLFVHGGIELDWLRSTKLGNTNKIDDINKYFGGRVDRVSDLKELRADSSIFWSRVLSQAPEEEVCGSMIDEILHHFRVARIVIGHNPQMDQLVGTRCDGKIILADVMMSRWMVNPDQAEDDMHGGRPAVILMTMTGGGMLKSIVAYYTDLATGTKNEYTDILITEGSPRY